MSKLSTWEKMTGNAVVDNTPPAKAKTMTAAEFKRCYCNKAAVKRGAAKFAKAANLSGKELRKMSDTWIKRTNTNAGSFWKEENNHV